MDQVKSALLSFTIVKISMCANNYICRVCLLLSLFLFDSSNLVGQCDPSSIDLCFVGSNSIVQATYHGQIIKTSNGYSITGQSLDTNGNADQDQLTQIPSTTYPMPGSVVPVWGAIGGRTQAVFIGSDNIIYAVGVEDLLIDRSLTPDNDWGPTSLTLPPNVTVCDINKWEGTVGSGDDGGNATGSEDGFIAFSTKSGALYVTGDGASRVYAGASNTSFTRIILPNDVTVVNFAVGYRTLLVQGSDCNLYASGSTTYLGDGNSSEINTPTILSVQPPISIEGIKQIEAGFNSYLVLDGDGTIHVIGENTEGSLGVGNTDDQVSWTKVGNGCTGVLFGGVEKISTLSTHDYRSASSAILEDGTIRSWGINHRNSITSGVDRVISCPIKPIGTNQNAIAISNGGHISPYVNSSVQICNIGHNKDGAFGDGNQDGGNYEEYDCFVIPGNPEVCGTNDGDVIEIVPIFNQLGPYCINEVPDILSTSSDDIPPFTGMWVSDVISTTTVGITTYTFIPDPGQCIAIDTATMDIEVMIPMVPIFVQIDTICVNDDTTDLPMFSDNQSPISGVWNPTTIITTSPGSSIYTFIPSDDCIETFEMEIFIKDCECQDPTMIQIEPIASICEGEQIELIATLGGSATSMTWTTTGAGTIIDPTSTTTSYVSSPIDAVNGSVNFIAITNDPDGLFNPCVEAISSIIVSILPKPLPPNIFDVNYCQGDTPSPLAAGGQNLTWYDIDGNQLSGAPIPSTSSVGIYSFDVSQQLNGCESDLFSVQVTIAAFPIVEAGPSVQLSCDKSAISLQGSVETNISELSLIWSGPGIASGATSINPVIVEPGMYTLTATNVLSNCSSIDSVIVTLDETAPDFELIIVNPLCQDISDGEIILENITGGESPYEIAINGLVQTGTDFTGLDIGTYNINVSDANGCTKESSVDIINLEDWLLTVSSEESLVDKGQQVQIKSTLTNIDDFEIGSILWEPSLSLSCADCLSPIATPERTTTYIVTVVDDNGCVQQREITLSVNPSIYFPNIISINSPENNTFYPMGTVDESIEVLEMSIFDRWGNLVYFNESFMINDATNGWDGSINSNDAEMGVYVYIVKIYNGTDSVLTFSGDVMLLR